MPPFLSSFSFTKRWFTEQTISVFEWQQQQGNGAVVIEGRDLKSLLMQNVSKIFYNKVRIIMLPFCLTHIHVLALVH